MKVFETCGKYGTVLNKSAQQLGKKYDSYL